MNDIAVQADKQHRLEHLQRVFIGELHLCGCGNPEDAWTLLHTLLTLMPLYEKPNGDAARAAVGSDGAWHIVLSVMSEAELIEHGGGIGGSWITPKGEWVLHAIEQLGGPEAVTELLDGVGEPHDGDGCWPSCWQGRK